MTEVYAAVIGAIGVVLAAAIGVVGVVLARKVERVHHEVTPNDGKSAHDKLMQAIRQERDAALAEHERRLHSSSR